MENAKVQRRKEKIKENKKGINKAEFFLERIAENKVSDPFISLPLFLSINH